MNQLAPAPEVLAAGPEVRPADAEGPPETVLRPPRGWQLINLRELWQFRDLLYFLTWRDVKVRYKQTVLGAAWALLQPALMMVVFTVFFSRLARVSSGDVWYPLFAYAGLLPWSFFATAVANGGNSVVGSERLITRVYFPRLVIPLAAVGAAVVDFAVAFGLLAALMAACGVVPGWEALLAPVIVLLILLAATGMGALLAALNVAYRDFRYVIPFLIQLWMFATPTIYMDVFADGGERSALVEFLLTANPLTGLIAAFRASLLGTPMPWDLLGLSAAVALGLCFLGCLYFRKVEHRFADII